MIRWLAFLTMLTSIALLSMILMRRAGAAGFIRMEMHRLG